MDLLTLAHPQHLDGLQAQGVDLKHLRPGPANAARGRSRQRRARQCGMVPQPGRYESEAGQKVASARNGLAVPFGTGIIAHDTMNSQRSRRAATAARSLKYPLSMVAVPQIGIRML